MKRFWPVAVIVLCLALIAGVVGGMLVKQGRDRRYRLDVLLAEQFHRLRELPPEQAEYAAVAATPDLDERVRLRQQIERRLQELIATDDLAAKRDWLRERYRFVRQDVIRQRDVGEIDAATAAPVIARCDELLAELDRY